MEASNAGEQRILDPEHAGKRWSRRKKITFWGAAATVLLVAYFALPPVYDRLKSIRAGSFFLQGQELFERGQWTNALDRYELAMQMDPDQTRFRGALARTSEKISRDQAFRSWTEILRSPNVTSEERQDFVEFALGLGRLDFAAEQIATLMRRRPPEARSVSLAAEFYRLQGDNEQASVYAKAALVGSPDDEKLQFQYGSLLMASDLAAERQEGRKFVWELAGRTNRYQVDAWRRMAPVADLKPAEARQLVAWLDASPAATTNAILRADLLWVTDSAVQSRREALIAETVNRTATNNDSALQELTGWLNSRKAFETTANLITDSRMGTNLVLCTTRLEALAGLKRWDDADALLLRTDVPMGPVFRGGMRAFLRSLRGDAASETLAWDTVLRDCSTNFGNAMVLGTLSERIGRNDIALRAYSPFLNPKVATGVSLQANRQVYAIYLRQGDLKAARETLARVVVGQRVDERTKVDFYYLNILLGVEVRPTLEDCLREIRAKPDRQNFRILAAFAHVRQGDFPPGLQMLQSLPISPAALPARWRAVAMTVFRLNGKIAEQVQLSESLSNSGFSKAELQALQSIGRK